MCTSTSHGSPQERESTQTDSASATDCPAIAASSSSSIATSVSEMKETGNRLLKEGKPKAAVKAYTGALQNAALEQLDDHEKAVLRSNRSLAYVRAHLNAKVSSYWHPSLQIPRLFHVPRNGQYRSHMLGKVENLQAEADARQAAELSPSWPKPLHRLAQALQVTQLLPGSPTSCVPSRDKV